MMCFSWSKKKKAPPYFTKKNAIFSNINNDALHFF